MLTLKAPIQLHIAQNLTGNAEAFGERIRGNYGLLGAHFAAKDLLFLMTAPPELPEDLGGMTTLVNQQNTVDVRSVTMEVVNNVVNRILLDGTEQFTYQDQVYITTVLNRLGITNVAQFMEQVRQLRVENESTVHMTKLYREELERILQRQAAGEAAPALPLPPSREEEPVPQSVDPRVTLCMEILNRLDTTNLYETVHAFQRNWTGGVNTFRNQELKLSEQLRFSNAVSLAEIKQQVYQQPQLHLLHHLNAYEAGVLMEAPRDEEQVLSQAAAAALMTAVDNTVVEVLNRPQLRQEQWVQIKNALWQVAENTLSRFETYHSQPQTTVRQELRMDEAWNNYVLELKEYQTLYRQMYPKAVIGPDPSVVRPEREAVFLNHIREERDEEFTTERSTVLRERDTETQVTTEQLREIRQRTPEEPSRTAGQRPGSVPAPEAGTLDLTYWNQLREGDLFQQQEYTQIVHRDGPSFVAPEKADAPEERLPEGGEPARQETVVRRERESQVLREQLREIIQRQLRQEGIPRAPFDQGVPLIPALPREEGAAQEPQTGVGGLVERTQRETYLTYDSERELRRQILREALKHTEQLPGRTVVPPGDIWNLTYRNQIREGDYFHSEQTRMIHADRRQLVERGPEESPEKRLLGTSESVDRETVLRWERERETYGEKMRETRETAGQVPPVHERVEKAMPWLEPRQRTEDQPVPDVRPVPLTPREAEEQAPEVLLEEMTRIDQHNRTILQAVREESRRKETHIPTGPDIQRTMRDALRALNEPESVLREVYAQREEPAATVHPELTPREEALLRQAQPEDRALYEAVLAYQKDPEGTLAKGLLKPGNLGALHAELQKAAREEAPLELEHPGEEALRQRELLREQSETVLERFHHLPIQPRTILESPGMPPQAVKIVHKQAAPDVTEELLEQLEEQRTRSTVRTDTHEEVTHRQSHQVDVNQMERKVVAQTTEDITELVNRTLARQMRTISDQVYRQMEKRLQAERSRRGRL